MRPAWPELPCVPATGRVATEAPFDAPSDLAVTAACAAVVMPLVHPPATPVATAAPSTVGMSRYRTNGLTAATRKQTNPVINVPTAAAPSLTTAPSVVPSVGLAISFTATTRVTTMASFESTRAAKRWTSFLPDPRNSGSTSAANTIGAMAAAT
jgi:hypothetical protein